MAIIKVWLMNTSKDYKKSRVINDDGPTEDLSYYWDYYDDPIWFLKKQSELKHKLLGLVITQLILTLNRWSAAYNVALLFTALEIILLVIGGG